MKTEPLHDHFGLTIRGVNAAEELSPETIHNIKQLWTDHAVLHFPRQSLNEDELLRFTSYFGEPEAISRKDILSPYHPEIAYMSNFKYQDGRHVGAFADDKDVGWHSDQTFRENPSTGAILYGLEVPPREGAVSFANQYLAYESLPADLRDKIDGRTGVFSYAKRLQIFNPAELKDNIEQMKKTPDVRHRIVLTHPVTGRKALYADPNTLAAIDGYDDSESQELISRLVKYATDPTLVYDHISEVGDVLMWDNGCLLHRRGSVNLGSPRLMKRTTFRLSGEYHCLP